jgi:hypothetical protein
MSHGALTVDHSLDEADRPDTIAIEPARPTLDVERRGRLQPAAGV